VTTATTEVVLGYLDTVINRRAVEQLDDFVAPGYCGHGFHADRETLRSFLAWQAATAPDWRIDVQDVVAEGDRVVVRAIATGTRSEDAPGVPATPARARRFEWITIYRVDDELGKIVEAWVVAREDRLSR
jgi:predicted ester cyclase